MRVLSSVPVRDAVILAAGNGDRFKNSHLHSKLLHPVLGQPLILRTLETAADAGLSALRVVLGDQADRVRAVIEAHPIPGTTIRFTYNPEWPLENGVSALKARDICTSRRFALLMGDHLFEPSVLRRLASLHTVEGDCLLAVDGSVVDPGFADEATKVQLEGDRIVRIGKALERWDALDTGLFVFTPAIFTALAESCREGQTTLSAGVQRLAATRVMRGVPTGGASWFDVDTIDDLQVAESMLATMDSETA